VAFVVMKSWNWWKVATLVLLGACAWLAHALSESDRWGLSKHDERNECWKQLSLSCDAMHACEARAPAWVRPIGICPW
jgi:hypothetical protein